MNIQNIVRSTAAIIRITNLQKGNVVKYIEDSSYQSPEIFYGIVTDVLVDEVKTFIEIVTYKKTYNDVKVETKIINGEKDIALFPATPEEVEEHFDRIQQGVKDEIDDMSDKLSKKMAALKNLQSLIAGSVCALTPTPFETVTSEPAQAAIPCDIKY